MTYARESLNGMVFKRINNAGQIHCWLSAPELRWKTLGIRDFSRFPKRRELTVDMTVLSTIYF